MRIMVKVYYIKWGKSKQREIIELWTCHSVPSPSNLIKASYSKMEDKYVTISYPGFMIKLHHDTWK